MAKEYDISYALHGGSLLAAVRNVRMIPYDTELDILIDVKYYPACPGVNIRTEEF